MKRKSSSMQTHHEYSRQQRRIRMTMRAMPVIGAALAAIAALWFL